MFALVLIPRLVHIYVIVSYIMYIIYCLDLYIVFLCNKCSGRSGRSKISCFSKNNLCCCVIFDTCCFDCTLKLLGHEKVNKKEK